MIDLLRIHINYVTSSDSREINSDFLKVGDYLFSVENDSRESDDVT